MDKMANLINAINLVLDAGLLIGETSEGKYAFVDNAFFTENFNDLDWEVRTIYNETAKHEMTFAYVYAGGIRFGTSVNDSFIKEYEAHLKELKKQEAMA